MKKNYYSCAVEPCLRRKSRRTDWRAFGLMFLGFVIGSIAAFVYLMDMGMVHAEPGDGVAGVIKGHALYTPEEFCLALNKKPANSN